MSLSPLNILLADDDLDDCLFFKQALVGSLPTTKLTTVPDGEHLMRLLIDGSQRLPDVLFLDLNMPRKNGFECLTEIMQNPRLEALPVVVFSTSYEQDVVNQLFQNGAHYFIRKPPEFVKFKKIILQTLTLIAQGNTAQPVRENFVITLQGE
jgi:CheY-like chemotaxis protein